MRVVVSAMVVALFMTTPTFATPQATARQGSVRGITASAPDEYGAVRFTVSGTNPCGAVEINFGDGMRTATYPIRQLPVTVAHDYQRSGEFVVTVRGASACAGSATTRARVTAVRPGTTAPDWSVPQSASSSRFAGMDRNGDGIITRAEWRGSAQSFAVHDWNRDGVLSGDEVRPGAERPGAGRRGDTRNLGEWTQERFRTLDVNRDGSISRAEWRFDLEDFFRVDRNGDNQLALNEFLLGNDVDDDRGDRFDYLDLDGNQRIDRSEWHGSRAAFDWLDRNGDGLLTRLEAQGANDLGVNRRAGTRIAPRTVAVHAQRDWVDTGIDVGVNDLIEITATGRIYWASGNDQFADANGATNRPATPSAPIPYLDIGALIGRVGNSEPFLVGANLKGFRAASTGRLFLRVNDDRLDDNRGDFRASIAVTRR
jgi:hypothetical protein